MRYHNHAPFLALLFGVNLTFLALPATATNGYFPIGVGAKSRAMGGVGIAYSENGSMAATVNPANLTTVQQPRIDVSGDLMIPRRGSAHDSALLATDEVSGSNLFFFPAVTAAFPLNNRVTLGIATTATGANTRFNQSPGNPNGTFFNLDATLRANNNQAILANNHVGMHISQLQILPSMSMRVTSNHSIGFSLALAAQSIRAYGFGAFQDLGFTAGQEKVTDQGNDWSYGAGLRIGWLGNFFNQRLMLGTYYASRVYMTKFDQYENLLAEQGDFDIPPHFGLGIAIQPTTNWTIALDVARIQYERIAALANPGPMPEDPNFFFPTAGGCPVHCLGNDQGMGFGWKDSTIYKLGVAYRLNEKWSIRAGYNHADMPIQSNQILFNLIAPATVEDHVTLGFSYQLNLQTDISVNYVHAFKKTLTGKTPFYPAGITNFNDLTVDNAAISMYQHSLGISIGHRL